MELCNVMLVGNVFHLPYEMHWYQCKAIYM